MYKIYINDNPLYLVEEKAKDLLPKQLMEEALVAKYMGKPRTLFNFIDLLEKTKKPKSVVLFSDEFEQLVNDFAALYKIVEACGGLVFNPLNQLLVIFRKGRWDLPKGKMEAGETKEETAVREVMEETGIKTVELHKYVGKTYHTFKNRTSKRCIKKSYWYEMTSTDHVLTPQFEESIESANWVEVEPFLKNEKLIYPNIRDIITQYRQPELVS